MRLPAPTARLALASVLLLLSACGTPAAKDFRGSWKPLNQFQKQPTEIPLSQPYVFYAAPMDGTLKNMLTRWATDSGMTLSYKLPADYTLYTPVSKLHTSSITIAAEELSSIYTTQGVSVSASNNQILVGPASASQPEQPADNTPSTSEKSSSGANAN